MPFRIAIDPEKKLRLYKLIEDELQYAQQDRSGFDLPRIAI